MQLASPLSPSPLSRWLHRLYSADLIDCADLRRAGLTCLLGFVAVIHPSTVGCVTPDAEPVLGPVRLDRPDKFFRSRDQMYTSLILGDSALEYLFPDLRLTHAKTNPTLQTSARVNRTADRYDVELRLLLVSADGEVLAKAVARGAAKDVDYKNRREKTKELAQNLYEKAAQRLSRTTGYRRLATTHKPTKVAKEPATPWTTDLPIALSLDRLRAPQKVFDELDLYPLLKAQAGELRGVFTGLINQDHVGSRRLPQLLIEATCKGSIDPKPNLVNPYRLSVYLTATLVSSEGHTLKQFSVDYSPSPPMESPEEAFRKPRYAYRCLADKIRSSSAAVEEALREDPVVERLVKGASTYLNRQALL